MEVNLKLRKEECDLLSDPVPYRTLVGSLIYLTITRPDISYAVQQVSQFHGFSSAPSYGCIRRIIRYVHGTALRGLSYPAGTSLNLAHIVRLIMPGAVILDVLLRVGVCFLVWPLFLGKARNRTVFQVLY
ncbi:putative mitochondrial protein [Abeliophyllum distichum]|uniref:Mitochondrial protein n=1 Tax=Abeliophyllum distichum TaxID=126358 RepID=A0ABD1V4H2_9LAMI